MFINSLLKQKTAFLLLQICLLLASGTSAVKAQDTIPNKPILNGKLQWNDYSGQVDKNSTYWASTHWYVHYKYKILQYLGDTVIIDLQVWPALKADSWVLPDKKTDELLQHEQGHFDFARLLVLQFKKETDSIVFLKYNYILKLDSIFNSLLNNIVQTEKQYDNETNHMLNKPEQEKWNEKLSLMLKAEE
jgi:hypothetical protein